MSHNRDQDARWTTNQDVGQDDLKWREIQEELTDTRLRACERKIDLLVSRFTEFKTKQSEAQEECKREQSEINFEFQKQLLRLQGNSGEVRAPSVTEAELKALHDRLQSQEGMIIALINEVRNMKSRMPQLWESKSPPDISDLSSTFEASLLKGATQQALWTRLPFESKGGATSQDEQPDKDAQADFSRRVGSAAPRIEDSRKELHLQEVASRPHKGEMLGNQPSGPLASKKPNPLPKEDRDRHQTQPSGVVGPAAAPSREITTRADMSGADSAAPPGYQEVVTTSALFGSSHLSNFSRAHSYECKFGYSTVALFHSYTGPQTKQGLFIHFVDEEDVRSLRNSDCRTSAHFNDEECDLAGNQMTLSMYIRLVQSHPFNAPLGRTLGYNCAQVFFATQCEDSESGRRQSCTLDLYFITSDASGLWNRLVKIPIKFAVVRTDKLESGGYKPFAGGSHIQIMRPKKMYPGRLPESALRYTIEECDGKQWLNLNHYEPGARVLL